MSDDYHESVMVREIIEALHIKKLGKYIDATLGTGGHAIEILRRGGAVLGIDMDPKMVEIATDRIGKNNDFKAVRGNFTDIDKIAKENNYLPVSGILFDLGVSNIHLKEEGRGFSFENSDAELDMRLDREKQGVKGKDLLNVLREDQLRQMFEVTMEPGSAKWITGRVLHSRAVKPIEKVSDFLEIVRGLRTRKAGLNEATLPFLALRIAVNSELTNLEEALPKAFKLLEKKGRLIVISFHSGEDRIVKEFFGNSKAIVPSEEEVTANPRARSAKMRVLEKYD